jgi:ubiquinone/menaquinone biosynthesis C-methylase UbiE
MSVARTKPWKGHGMEGWVARWYNSTRAKDMEDFRKAARDVAQHVPGGARVLEIASGPGFFAIELAKIGDFRISGLDISHTMVEIARENARKAGVRVDFRWGNASEMPFADESFDFAYCSAAFKNFSEPVRAMDELYRVLRPDGEALIHDLSRESSEAEIDRFVRESGRGRVDGWITRWVFRHILLKRAYTSEDFAGMSKQSRFGECRMEANGIGIAVRLAKSGTRYCDSSITSIA